MPGEVKDHTQDHIQDHTQDHTQEHTQGSGKLDSLSGGLILKTIYVRIINKLL